MKHPDPFKNPERLFHLGVKALIRNKEGKVLVLEANHLTRNVSPHWDLPGGRLHKGEDLEIGLRREIKEEIGIDNLEIIQLLDASISKHRIDFHSGKSVGLVLFTYECQIQDTEIEIADDEHLQFKWVSPKEASKLLFKKFSDSLTRKIALL